MRKGKDPDPDDGSGSGSVLVTNGSGCESGRPKNIWYESYGCRSGSGTLLTIYYIFDIFDFPDSKREAIFFI
jgi:hypothetical protein